MKFYHANRFIFGKFIICQCFADLEWLRFGGAAEKLAEALLKPDHRATPC
jgi:hypothetical protein